MHCVNCKSVIPQGRVDLGYKECVDCSTVEAVSCVDITYHKTGNTIQVMDKATADKVNKLSQRAGYGIMRGLRGGKSPKSNTRLTGSVRVFRIPTDEDYARTLKELEFNLDRGRDWCIDWIESLYASHTISSTHVFNLRTIVNTLLPLPDKATYTEDNKVDDEIAYAFRNWKM
jgi:hypothetical protein